MPAIFWPPSFGRHLWRVLRQPSPFRCGWHGSCLEDSVFPCRNKSASCGGAGLFCRRRYLPPRVAAAFQGLSHIVPTAVVEKAVNDDAEVGD